MAGSKREAAASPKKGAAKPRSGKGPGAAATAEAAKEPEVGLLGWLCLQVLRLLGWLVVAYCLVEVCKAAYQIRMFAIDTFGPVIHEFDPWFNYRATEFLAQRGWKEFFSWFDYMAWYPLGRPVATTIYPGMQIASVAIWKVLQWLNLPWTVNDVCCYVPCWFGAAASIFIGLLAGEAMHTGTGVSGGALVAGAGIMAVIPAHAKRSIGGGFDNEAVAITPMCAAFYFWVRSLRTDRSWPFAILSGASFAFMAASWGGYVFCSNVIGVHAAVLVFTGYNRPKLHRAYSAFFIAAVLLACQVPVVGWLPFKSLEQIGPFGLFGLMQVVALYPYAVTPDGRLKYPSALYALSAVGVVVLAWMVSTGYFAPFSGRVKALFGVSATKTGNPLVDSVSEHRPSSPDAYWTYLNWAGYAALGGPIALLARPKWPSEAALFIPVLGVLTQFFSLKMARLIVLCGPSVSALAGCAVGGVIDMGLLAALRLLGLRGLGFFGPPRFNGVVGRLVAVAQLGLVAAAAVYAYPYAREFYDSSFSFARYSLSHPRIMSRNSRGQIVDNIREAYFWLKRETAEDARVLSWWDYGYQISGVANRTTLADGNTWNIEHIGLIGMALSAPIEEGHRIMRHIADYVLVWEEDVGKSTHMAKIAHNVFPGHCEEGTCNQYGILKGGSPTRMMRESMIWNMNRQKSDRYHEFFEDVFDNGKVRIARVLNVSEESRRWVADPSNRVCDSPGSWLCRGQYPPQLRQLMGWEEGELTPEAVTHRAEYAARLARQQAEAPGPHGPGITPGSYRDSCQGCRMLDDGHTLYCRRCNAPSRAGSDSRLDVRDCNSGLVDNLRGELRCKPKPNRKNIPKGGYAGSCQGCQLTSGNKVLSCTNCGTSDGDQRPSSIALDRCPAPYNIDNNDGTLQCTGIPNEPNIPAGKYQGSCTGCAVVEDGAVLRCSHCAKASREQVVASIPLASCPPPGKLDNNDGRLVCKDLTNAPDIPDGGYKHSCGGCRKDGSQLVCLYCQAADGQSRAASLDLSGCSGKIDNDDGKLVCLAS